jgi:hypothetical protein
MERAWRQDQVLVFAGRSRENLQFPPAFRQRLAQQR